MEFVERDHKKEVMIRSNSGPERKLSIKFKFPKLPATVKVEKSPPTSSSEVIGSSKAAKLANQGKRVCLECKKEFKSGKAFGGHMRVHVQAAGAAAVTSTVVKKSYLEDDNNGDEKESTTERYMRCVNDEGKPKCSLCAKIFPSMKSLFGHMRCHPDRNWRGILHPPSATAAGDEEGGEVVDLTKFLWRWPARDKRGRKKLGTAEDDDEVLQEAVEDLLSLAYGGPSMAEIEGTNSNSLTNKVKIDDKSPSPDVFDKGSSTMEDEIEEKSKLDFVSFLCSNKTKKMKKMKLMTELELGLSVEMIGSDSVPPLPPPPAAAAADGKYKCTTCNKCFASYQALGGHRSSHNKFKIISMDNDEEVEIVKKEIEFEASAMAVVGNEGLHQCKDCNKIYSTGQALGGHKRCHWIGPTEQKTPLIPVGYAGEMGGGRKVLDFDLNEVPQLMKEDEAGNGCGNGTYASSSYNSNMN